MQKNKDEIMELKESRYFNNAIPLMERGKYTPKSMHIMRVLSNIFLILGLLMIIFHILNKIFWNPDEPVFNGLLTGGLLLLSQGLNYKIYGLPGYEYVRINNDGIEVKNSYFSRIHNARWDQISNIEIKTLLITINMKDMKNKEIDLSWSTYNNVHLIKDKIKKFAEENNITVI
jgi:hypothetical protein